MMKSFIRRVRAALQYGKHMPFIEQAEDGMFWTPADARVLETFLNSYTGRKLKLRLTNYTIKAAIDATGPSTMHAYQAGIAAGIGMGIGALEEHLPALTQREEQELTEQTQLEEAFE